MRKPAPLLALAVATLAALGPVASAAASSPVQQAGAPYTVLQMNLCLSGVAGCYPRTAYPAIVAEAAGQILEQDAQAVTLNEACRGDAERLVV